MRYMVYLSLRSLSHEIWPCLGDTAEFFVAHCIVTVLTGTVPNLKVALISKINCRLLANEKTDSKYNV